MLLFAVLTVHTAFSRTRYRMIPCKTALPASLRPAIMHYQSETPGGDSSYLHVIKAAIEKEPKEPLFYYALGVIYFNKRQYTEAVAAFEAAAAKGYKRDADFYLHIGTACLQSKQFSKGFHHLYHCLNQRPNDTTAMQALAQGLYQHGDYKQSVAYWEQLLRLQPENAFVMFMLGKAYIAHGDTKKGQQWCDKATAGL
ncbi:tetratricopeptide repeat protein [Chitinophaga sp.]|uniref:tetratricopeptide repeat protein n=1 Tax=Chitinophaga sp. TaxID=1869181 RepID=UPI0031D72472